MKNSFKTFDQERTYKWCTHSKQKTIPYNMTVDKEKLLVIMITLYI